MHCEHHDHDTAPMTVAEKARSERATREDDAYFDGVVRNDPPEPIVRHDDVRHDESEDDAHQEGVVVRHDDV